ncbi:MAG: ABC transporter ATP-binding protein [Aliidongia sp.]
MNQLVLGHPGYDLTERFSIPEEPVKAAAGVALRFEGLAKSFGRTAVLQDVDFEVEPGEFLAIVGQSGSGKSTLLRLIAGLDRASAGGIELDGRRLQGRATDARMMFQEARLLPWRSVEQNVLIGAAPGTPADAARAALAQVGLAEKSGAWPAELSGGQRQRVALARALISRPRLLLLDEPLGALDALTRIEMQDLVERVWRAQGFTAVLVTHDVGEAVRLADRVIVLERGRIAETWSVDTARPRPRVGGGDIEAAILARLLGREG